MFRHFLVLGDNALFLSSNCFQPVAQASDGDYTYPIKPILLRYGPLLLSSENPLLEMLCSHACIQEWAASLQAIRDAKWMKKGENMYYVLQRLQTLMMHRACAADQVSVSLFIITQCKQN